MGLSRARALPTGTGYAASQIATATPDECGTEAALAIHGLLYMPGLGCGWPFAEGDWTG
jgi:hypothetical protein